MKVLKLRSSQVFGTVHQFFSFHQQSKVLLIVFVSSNLHRCSGKPRGTRSFVLCVEGSWEVLLILQVLLPPFLFRCGKKIKQNTMKIIMLSSNISLLFHLLLKLLTLSLKKKSFVAHYFLYLWFSSRKHYDEHSLYFQVCWGFFWCFILSYMNNYFAWLCSAARFSWLLCFNTIQQLSTTQPLTHSFFFPSQVKRRFGREKKKK